MSNVLLNLIYRHVAVKSVVVAATRVYIILSTVDKIIIINDFKIIFIRINILFNILTSIDKLSRLTLGAEKEE